jgi:hypothetical protein
MGESYCNDGSCGLTRRGQIHPAHVGAPPSIEKLDRNEIVENPVVGGLYYNDGNCPLTRRGEKSHRVHIGVLAADADTQDYCDIKYIGGHKAHPSATNTKMYFYNDRIQIGNPKLTIPYSAITNIENTDEQKISAGRVIGLGLILPELAIVGAMWKKKHLYTVIQYKDELDNQTILIDFEGNINEAQPLIYHKMLEFRKK